MEHKIRVVIADDHLIVREGLRLILETAADIELIGEAADGAQAVEMAGELKPDVVLMDLQMPRLDGLAAIDRIRAQQPEIAIVILTTYNEDDRMVRGLRAGALGYLLKDTDRETLLNTIRAAARGETLLKPEIVQRVLARARSAASAPQRDLPGLTERERQVLALIVRGAQNKEIAARLNITERTVKAHLASIFNRLGVNSRTEAAAVAVRNGIVDDPPEP
ncbi:MAG: response regulator transcription factor [Chloroflexi bacterium]|nr:response regulator transcription factor [Chloroflexota bacterium]